MENRTTAARFLTLRGSSDVNVIKVIPTGSIIAATVCSPTNDARTPDTTDIPRQIRDVLVPVMRTMNQAMRLSSFWRTTATASINEPMINNTLSVIRLRATSVEPSPSRTT